MAMSTSHIWQNAERELAELRARLANLRGVADTAMRERDAALVALERARGLCADQRPNALIRADLLAQTLEPRAAWPADAAYAQGRLDERAEVCAWLRTLDQLELAKHIDQCTHTDYEPPGEGT